MRGEYNDLLLDYRKYFFEEFINRIGGKLSEDETKNNLNRLGKYKSADGSALTLDIKRIEERIIIDSTIKDIDKIKQNIKADEKNKIKVDDEEIDRKFITFLKRNCGEFQQARSFDKIRVAIYQIFEKYLGVKDTDKLYIKKIVLGNLGFFQSIIKDSVREYAKHRRKTEKQYKEISKWNVPREDYYSKNTVIGDYNRCVMTPAYVSPKWKTEMGFIENYLEKNKNIAWWFKNGDAKNEIYLGIPYIDEKDKPATFYPDFVVCYRDGKIGIFDTKGGQTATSGDTKLKAWALQIYIKENKARKLFGGIAKSDKENMIWTLNQDKKYDYENGEWTALN